MKLLKMSTDTAVYFYWPTHFLYLLVAVPGFFLLIFNGNLILNDCVTVQAWFVGYFTSWDDSVATVVVGAQKLIFPFLFSFAFQINI